MRQMISKTITTEVCYSQAWPKHADLNMNHSIVIYDQILTQNKKIFNQSKKWIEKFPHRIPVKAGENLKNLSSFSKVLEQLIPLVESCQKPLQIIAIGGGSVGDFSGFLSSVLKRGVDLIQIPSTWLAAIDSAHGGKNALNITGYKNQIGTFHFAKKVIMIKPLLSLQPLSRVQEAMGEALKISLLDSKKLWLEIQSDKRLNSNNQLLSVDSLWILLPSLVAAKYKIVKKDPYERIGIRHLLNFGHTVGHVLEAQLHLPHGEAVLAGLGFALQYSVHKKILSHKEYRKIKTMPLSDYILTDSKLAILLSKIKNPKAALLQDKKMNAKKSIRFIFLRKVGQGVVLSVTIDELIAEIKRQSK